MKNKKNKTKKTKTKNQQRNKQTKVKKRYNLQAILYPRMTKETWKLTAMSLSYKTMRTLL